MEEKKVFRNLLIFTSIFLNDKLSKLTIFPEIFKRQIHTEEKKRRKKTEKGNSFLVYKYVIGSVWAYLDRNAYLVNIYIDNFINIDIILCA